MTERTEENTASGKRRRLQGSCDMCRKKKVRCNSAEMPDNRCSNCISLKAECTHHRFKIPARRATPPLPGQQTAQEHLAAIFSTTTVYIPSNDPLVSHEVLLKVAHYARDLEASIASLREELRASKTQLSLRAELDHLPSLPLGTRPILVEHEDSNPNGLVQSGPKEAADQLYGKSISIQFLKTAIKHMHGNTSYVVGVRRPEFWTPQPWDKLIIESPHQIFPEDDLLHALVQIYFAQINPVLGVLHAPSFNQSIAEKLHLRDKSFGAVLLVVCALGSRYSEDRRVLLEGATSQHSCGWKWFRQVLPIADRFAAEHALYQLQLICLSISYLGGSDIATPSEQFVLAGLGLRFAHAAGVNRRNGYITMDPLTAELSRRVVWILIISDTIMSSFKGQPSITQSANFDLDLPVDCDEEYWAVQGAVQPSGVPASGAFLSVYIQLMMIFGRIQGAVYPVHGQICSEDVVVELDSALNQWLDVIPEHLKWDPNQENQVFLTQSAVLYSTYYHAQVLIHRPFIPAPGEDMLSTSKFPSLAICASAARSCGHVLDVQTRRAKPLHNPHMVIALFDCAVMLLVNVWAVTVVGGRKSRGPHDFDRATADVQNYLRVLRLYERRWRSAGRKCDIITAMLNIGKYTATDDPRSSPPKRPREATPGPSSSNRAPEPPVVLTLNPPEPINLNPVSVSASVSQQMQALEQSFQETESLFSLPLSTDELGRLPIYDSFDYQFTFDSADYAPDFQSRVGDSAPVFGGMDPGSIFSAGQSGSSSSGGSGGGGFVGQQIPLPPGSFGAPVNYQWDEWSAYLASVDGLGGQNSVG